MSVSFRFAIFSLLLLGALQSSNACWWRKNADDVTTTPISPADFTTTTGHIPLSLTTVDDGTAGLGSNRSHVATLPFLDSAEAPVNSSSLGDGDSDAGSIQGGASNATTPQVGDSTETPVSSSTVEDDTSGSGSTHDRTSHLPTQILGRSADLLRGGNNRSVTKIHEINASISSDSGSELTTPVVIQRLGKEGETLMPNSASCSRYKLPSSAWAQLLTIAAATLIMSKI